MRRNWPLVFGLFIAVAMLFSACKPANYTVLVQNTNQYWDSLSFCMVLSDNDDIDYDSKLCDLKGKDSVVWEFTLMRTDTNTFYAKTFPLKDLEKYENYWLKYTIDLNNGERVTTGTEQIGYLTEYTIITLKNKGYAYDLLEFSTNKKPKYDTSKLRADDKTLKFLTK